MHPVLRTAIPDSLRLKFRSVCADRFKFAVLSSAGVRLSFAFVMGVRAAQEGHFVEDVFLEPLEPEINDRRDEERDHLRENQAADDNKSKRAARRRIRTEAERERDGAHEGRE